MKYGEYSQKTRCKYPGITSDRRKSEIMPSVLQNLKNYYEWDTCYYFFKERHDHVGHVYFMHTKR